MSDTSLDSLVAALVDARAAAEAMAGAPAAGVRAIEPATGRRWYLCAFDGPGFLCLDAALAVERDLLRVHQAAACALLVEHAEGLVEQGELDILAGAASALSTHVEAVDLGTALDGLRASAIDLAAWRAAPERAVASLSDLEAGIRLHDVVRSHYERYVAATESLVEIQDRLADELVAALRDLEEAAGRAGITRALSGTIAEAINALDAGAVEIVAKLLAPLD